MNQRTILLVIGGVVLLYVLTRRSTPAPAGGVPSTANLAAVGASLGGYDFGVLDPGTWN